MTTERLPAAQRRRQLMDVAIDQFAANGFAATSMNGIAAAGGVTKPVLYQHFSSKRDLFLELLRDVRERLVAGIREATAGAESPRSQVEAGITAFFHFMSGDTAGFTILTQADLSHDDDVAREGQTVESTLAEMTTELLAVSGQDRAKLEVLAQAIVGMAKGASRHWLRAEDRLPPDELASEIAAFAWFGLRGLGGPADFEDGGAGPGRVS